MEIRVIGTLNEVNALTKLLQKEYGQKVEVSKDYDDHKNRKSEIVRRYITVDIQNLE